MDLFMHETINIACQPNGNH